MELDKHVINKDEVDKVKALGFLVECSIGIVPEEFLNIHFKGLELFNFFELIDSLLKPQAVLPISKKLILTDPPPKMVLTYLSSVKSSIL